MKKNKEGQYVEDPLHIWFGLTYAQFLTLPRVIMEAMPIEWQEQMVKLLEEMDEAFEWLPEDAQFWVSMRDNKGKYKKLPRALCNYRRPSIEHLRKKKCI